jgi:hypothetical protein
MFVIIGFPQRRLKGLDVRGGFALVSAVSGIFF